MIVGFYTRKSESEPYLCVRSAVLSAPPTKGDVVELLDRVEGNSTFHTLWEVEKVSYNLDNTVNPQVSVYLEISYWGQSI